MCDSKLVIVSEAGYNQKYDSFLQSLLQEGCELVCFVGKDCRKWAEKMEALAEGKRMTVVSHPGESVDAVIAFANAFITRNSPESEADIVYI